MQKKKKNSKECKIKLFSDTFIYRVYVNPVETPSYFVEIQKQF